jgi:hypothetical protein
MEPFSKVNQSLKVIIIVFYTVLEILCIFNQFYRALASFANATATISSAFDRGYFYGGCSRGDHDEFHKSSPDSTLFGCGFWASFTASSHIEDLKGSSIA